MIIKKQILEWVTRGKLQETFVNIEYFHASKYGNGAMVAKEFKKQMATKGVFVNVPPIPDVRPQKIPQADLYIFSSPGRMVKQKEKSSGMGVSMPRYSLKMFGLHK